MIYISGLVGFLLVLTAEARIGNSSESEFCTETKQCLLYDLVCEHEEYEVRHYDSVKWVSTEEKSYFMEKATITAFRRLFEYITGANESGEKIDMTAPVLVKVEKKKNIWDSCVYTMSFLLPAEHQQNPPKPTDDMVHIHDMPDMKVYVRSYGGWMMSFVDKMNAQLLTWQLDTDRAQYNQDYHYAVGYDSPMKLFNRHNEVWYVVEGEPVCPANAVTEPLPSA
ncbi:heme-binding protein 2 [Centroberyx affinis]|uniref:heme-binding protein 2 n=1 Tax=Centroberyx affinis TaxID=166261 RepID=UPI003A5C171C